MGSSSDIDIAVLRSSLEHLEQYVHEAEARCKERDQKALDEIAGLKLENEMLSDKVTTLEKKLTTSAIVWATICGTVATLFAGAVWAVNKAIEWKSALQGVNK